MAIPTNIEHEHILSALKEIDTTPERTSRLSDRYFLRYKKKDYPPKLVISIANKYANGVELDPDPGIFNTYMAQDYLRKHKYNIIDLYEITEKAYTGFKLISLDIRNNSFLGTVTYDFIDLKDEQHSIYTTVLIGPNGTGKSNLFRVVIELLKELYDLSIGSSRNYNVDGHFSLKYSLDNNLFDYTNLVNYEKTGNDDSRQSSYLLKNGKMIDFKFAKLPTAIVANSIMLTDKYPVYNTEEVFPIYKYLGVRNRAQNASTRSYVRKTIEFIVQELDSSPFRKGLTNVTSFLGLGNNLEITYHTSNANIFFKGDLHPNRINEYFTDIRKRYEKSATNPPFKLRTYTTLAEDKHIIQEICNFCNQLVKDQRLTKINRSSIRKLNYDIINEQSFQNLKKEFDVLEKLRQLGFLTPPEVNLKRVGNYSLQESSSGEYHFFSSIVGLMSTVKPNSLIFIDEPEVSLHPNWQMQYLSFIRKLFPSSEFATSHIIVATHSHFLISDLDGKDSKIIGLQRKDGIQIVDLPERLDTYGWSAEDVLYNVFNVPTTRNKYVAAEISQILTDLSEGSMVETNRLSKKKYDLLLYLNNNLKDIDPLKEVVKSILKKITVK